MSRSASIMASLVHGSRNCFNRKLIPPRRFPAIIATQSFASKGSEEQAQEVMEGRRFFPRRCVMYVPGDSEKMLSKSLTIKPDSLVFDCEDGVAANKKVCVSSLC